MSPKIARSDRRRCLSFSKSKIFWQRKKTCGLTPASEKETGMYFDIIHTTMLLIFFNLFTINFFIIFFEFNFFFPQATNSTWGPIQPARRKNEIIFGNEPRWKYLSSDYKLFYKLDYQQTSFLK